MKHILLTTIAAVVLVGCGESQQSVPPAEANPVEPVAEAAQPEPPKVKAPDISIELAASKGNIEVVKQYIAAGTDVNAKDKNGGTPLFYAAAGGSKEIVELLIAKGADVNAKHKIGHTPLDWAIRRKHPEIVDLLRKHGGKTGEELKATGENKDSAKESEDKAGESDGSEDSAAELLRKMKERRRQEVGE